MEALENKFGFGEIVDTLTDLVTAVSKFSETLQGKFDIIKFLSFALENYPKVREAVEDWPTFVAELKDLTPEEGLQAIQQIELNTPKTPVAGKMVDTLKLLALTYDFAGKTYTSADILFRFGKGIFS